MSNSPDLNKPADTLDPTVSTRIVASCFALAAFALALLSGLTAGNQAHTTIGNALFWLAACYVLGIVIARVANTAVSERLAEYREERPIPVSDPASEIDDEAIETTELADQPVEGIEVPPPAQPVQAA